MYDSNTAPTAERKRSDSPYLVSSTAPSKRVILTMGGKGGVGKTSFMLVLAEWFESHEIPVTLLDLDTENKSRGSLKHYFDGKVTKVNIHTAAGLDAFVDHLADGAPIILADMGASSGQVTHEWFDGMFEDVAATGVAFTAIGIVTPDPASVESILSWAARLQDRVNYVVVENAMTHQADFSQAFRVVPSGKQPGMRSVKLRGKVLIDPNDDSVDLFTKIIEERKRNKHDKDLYYWLKILAN
jgi:MinD-like ATPase involved in chromosome partitioning or flagellar assembly